MSNAITIDAFHDPELFRLVDKQFRKDNQQQKQPDAYEISLDNKSTLLASQVTYNKNQEHTLSASKEINIADLKPERIHATLEYTTDLRTLEQKPIYHLFLDEKISERQHSAKTPLETTKHGVAIHGDLDQHLAGQLKMSLNDLTALALVSTISNHPNFKADQETPAIFKNAIPKENEVAVRIFDDVSLTNEFATNLRGIGSTQDLNKYYQLTQSDLSHIDAYSVSAHKEVIAAQVAAKQQYEYVGIIHHLDHSAPSTAYTNANEYLHAIEEALKTRPQKIEYDTIAQDPQLHKAVDDLYFKMFGLNNPNPIEHYTQQEKTPLNLNEANNPQISIMELAKEMGFAYRNTNLNGDAMMQKFIQPNENTPQITQIDLAIKNADNPLTNTVTVEYTRFPDSKSMTPDANFNPIVQDADYHLSFKQFVTLTKTLNSEEIVKDMEKSRQHQQYTTETKPQNDFYYETSSIRPQQNLINDLEQKFKLDPQTIATFAPFMEAAHPANKQQNDKSADIVVFPYVMMDNQYNLKGHLQSTMSGEPSAEKTTNSTNNPIAYEYYTKGQNIPFTQNFLDATTSGGVWMATTAQNPQAVKDVFMFNSAVDAMSFYETHRRSIDLNNTALISVGSLAKENQFLGIAERFPDATYHTAFNNTLLGQLSNITVIAAPSIGSVKFETADNNSIKFTTPNDSFTMPIKDINLLSFKEKAHVNDHGINNNLDIKIHRPQGESYNADLQQNKQNERQEHQRSIKL